MVPHRFKAILKNKYFQGFLLFWIISSIVLLLRLWNNEISQSLTSSKPIWNIAHMVNTVPEADEALIQGANGLEFDIRFTAKGYPLQTGRGYLLCDCNRNCSMSQSLANYLSFIRNISDPGNAMFREQLNMVMLDLKSYDLKESVLETAGRELADIMIKNLWEDGSAVFDVRFVLSIPKESSLVMAAAFHEEMEKQMMQSALRLCGWLISGYLPPEIFKRSFETVNFTCRTWQSDGLVNCWYYFWDRLYALLEARNETTDGKVLFWTVDEVDGIEEVLDLGVDAILTNRVDNVQSVINQRSEYRLATKADNPFKEWGPCEMAPVSEVSRLFLNFTLEKPRDVFYITKIYGKRFFNLFNEFKEPVLEMIPGPGDMEFPSQLEAVAKFIQSQAEQNQ